jgi:murein DD-endopeptidase MepM/ murein hydrolase activator NlpD
LTARVAVGVVSALAILTLAVGIDAPVTAGGCDGLRSHWVVAGDTWFDIARGAGVSMRSLLETNGVDENQVLHPGDVVCLPGGATTASRCTPVNAPTYTVVRKDTWWQIAERAGIGLGALLAANGADDSTIIRPGLRVCLPMGSTIGAPAASDASSETARSTGSGTLAALPMQGPCWFSDSWGAPRGNGRRHVGTDLFAEIGSYVYAVVDGTLTRRSWDQPGRSAGNAWWLTAGDGSGTYYFYAHLADFAPELEVGSQVDAGEIIGFMGNTGNSAFAHLHFEIHPGGGGPVNPYPLLRTLGGCRSGSAYRQPSGWVPD